MRAFNRFYTEQIGALDERHEGLGLTLAQSRCLFTIDRLGTPDTGALANRLGLDLGYVSRLVSRLVRAGYVARSRGDGDHRRRVLTLTPTGRDLLSEVARRSDARVTDLTDHLRPTELKELLGAMDTIHRLLTPEADR